MRLDELAPNSFPGRSQATFPPGSPVGTERPRSRDIAFDSREVGPGTLFFCVVGHTADGHDFAPDVVGAGPPRWSPSGSSISTYRS